jgi:hypothetical protein
MPDGPAIRHHVRAVRQDGAGRRVAHVIGVTDDDGRYEIHAKPGTYRIGFGAHGYEVELAAGAQRRLDHADVIGCRIVVRVRGDGIRLRDARVVVERNGDGEPAQRLLASTNEAGIATIEGVRPGPAQVAASIHLLGAGGPPVPARTEVEVPANQDQLTVVLDAPAHDLDLQVCGPAGAPIAGASVELRPLGGGVRRGRTDADGTLRVTHLPEGRLGLVADAPEHAPQMHHRHPRAAAA